MKNREQRHEPVFKSAVHVTNQEECDALKALCIKYSLPIWKDKCAFGILDHNDAYLFYANAGHGHDDYCFYIDIRDDQELEEYDIVSVEEFEQLAEQLSPEYDSIDDILSKMKELNKILNP
tara:strand:- start:920 stop:1282 length:363 start_codon:yes stop_codon:yes gene_type:complete